MEVENNPRWRSLDFRCCHVCKLRYKYLRIGGRHLGFSTSGLVVAYNIPSVSIRLLDLENMAVAVKILSLESIEVEIRCNEVLFAPHYVN